jgi:hypothetical protein
VASLLGINTRGITAREVWGYSTWLFFGLVFGLPESWAGAAMIIVAWLVVLAFHLAFFPWPDLTL